VVLVADQLSTQDGIFRPCSDLCKKRRFHPDNHFATRQSACVVSCRGRVVGASVIQLSMSDYIPPVFVFRC